MLKFIKRVSLAPKEPLPGMSTIFSDILRMRGIDTAEKADRFLHPSYDQLNDPFLMRDMDKAVTLIHQAIDAGEPITVYGDYDVDGVCSTSIMLETLRELGADVAWRIPDRRTEGYGLNETAVRELSEQGTKLLLTVDCGVTNLDEVKLAKMLGMKVIVTDHHRLNPADSSDDTEEDFEHHPVKLPEADAVLNPLLGSYPYRWLCGAGVALKICQALLGMKGVYERIELAAMATVADVMPLTDENRVIVYEGLIAMEQTKRPGLRGLMTLSGAKEKMTSEHLAFYIGPRLNSAGRLEDAGQNVELLTTTDEQRAWELAQHLNDLNSRRRGIENEAMAEAQAQVIQNTDFLEDRILIVSGNGWNKGVIGLVAGKLCEQYHYPVIALSNQEDGTSVGSCRSIPGVHMHQLLMGCEKEHPHFFIRCGGHAQAAGLTIRTELVPELKQLMNRLIKSSCDESCYIPTSEYDMKLSMSDIDLNLIGELEQLQPTGEGNPSPVFLSRSVDLQSSRRVGADGNTLKASFYSDGKVLGGVGFRMGQYADEGFGKVDILYAPDRNEYNGRVSAQLKLKSMTGADRFRIDLSPEEGFALLLKDIPDLITSADEAVPEYRPINRSQLIALLKEHQRGTLILTRNRELFRSLTAELDDPYVPDLCAREVKDSRGFTTVLVDPSLSHLKDNWVSIILADGDLLPGELSLIRKRCPRATLYIMKENPERVQFLKNLQCGDDAFRSLYKRLRRGGSTAVSVLGADCGMSGQQVLLGLWAFNELKLADVSLQPYAVSLLPPVKCSLGDSPALKYIRNLRL